MRSQRAYHGHTAPAGVARASVVVDRGRAIADGRWLVNCSFMGTTVKPARPRRLRSSPP